MDRNPHRWPGGSYLWVVPLRYVWLSKALHFSLPSPSINWVVWTPFPIKLWLLSCEKIAHRTGPFLITYLASNLCKFLWWLSYVRYSKNLLYIVSIKCWRKCYENVKQLSELDAYFVCIWECHFWVLETCLWWERENGTHNNSIPGSK